MTKLSGSIIALAVFVALIGVALASGPASAAESNAAQVARGAKAYVENCERCHNYRDAKEFSDRRWDVIVNHMRAIAPIPGQVARDIRAFLKASN